MSETLKVISGTSFRGDVAVDNITLIPLAQELSGLGFRALGFLAQGLNLLGLVGNKGIHHTGTLCTVL